jgi:DNA polymerase III alpha subunit (gram-positive type)
MEPSTNEDLKRNIILVGHDVEADIKFLQSIGYDVHTLSTLRETVDTSLMWRYIKRENNPRNLASILAEVGIISWNLHNAGNDAVYTLQAMIAIALMDMTERQKQKEIKEQEQQSTVTK